MSAIHDMIRREAMSLSDDEVQHFAKVAGFNLSNAGILAGGALAGFLGRHFMGDHVSDQERAELEAKANQRALLGAGIGAAGALALRKPVQGLVAPDPEDMVYMNDDEFDDLWKQRRRSR